MEAIVTYALSNGHSVAWDGDVSEKTFKAREGIAIIPTDPRRADLFRTPGEELKVDQAMRQEAFESYVTTDDHLMHLVGISEDQGGHSYFITKNSWGKRGEHEGYLHMSSAYFRLKTIGIMVHKDAIPADIAKKLLL